MLKRHLIYLGNDSICAYRWERGSLSAGTVYSNDGAGLDALLDALEASGRAPVYLLADLIEEDFQRLQLPHVGGRAGAKLMQRRLLQQYRETPFRHHEVQGREVEGRRDDIVLLSALTNPGVVQPLVDALEALQMPLAGLYSTTLLGEYLVRKLGWRDEHLLLVTQQTAGWRQSYFQRGQLKFSRLTPAIDRDGQAVDIGKETAKTQQFLTSVRLVARGSVLEAAVVASNEQLALLDAQCSDGPETAFRFLTLAQVAQELGLKHEAARLEENAIALADTMLLTVLARTRPASHYTLGPQRRYYRLWRLRRNLNTASATLAIVAACAIAVNLWQGEAAREDGARLAAEARQYDARYNAVMAAMPPRVTSTANMRAAVNVERMLALQGPTPWQMVNMVSRALEQSPQIHLLQLDWKADLPGAAQAVPAVTGAANSTVAPMSSLLAGIPTRPPQTLLLEAEVLADQDDYRTAVTAMNSFAQLLATQPQLIVQIDKPPIDTRSSVRLNGKAGAQAVSRRATFTLNLAWKP